MLILGRRRTCIQRNNSVLRPNHKSPHNVVQHLSETAGFALGLEEAEDVVFADGSLDVTDDGAGLIVHELDADLGDTTTRTLKYVQHSSQLKIPVPARRASRISKSHARWHRPRPNFHPSAAAPVFRICSQSNPPICTCSNIEIRVRAKPGRSVYALLQNPEVVEG